jgi:formate dehydrogenase maturation protein FdhE
MAEIETIETKTVEAMGIRCPICGSYDYLSYSELYDDEWISLKCQCLACKALFQINYKAVSIDELREPIKL